MLFQLTNYSLLWSNHMKFLTLNRSYGFHLYPQFCYYLYHILVLGVHWMNQLHNSSLKPNINEWHMVFAWTNMMENKNIASIWSVTSWVLQRGSNSLFIQKNRDNLRGLCQQFHKMCIRANCMCSMCTFLLLIFCHTFSQCPLPLS